VPLLREPCVSGVFCGGALRIQPWHKALAYGARIVPHDGRRFNVERFKPVHEPARRRTARPSPITAEPVQRPVIGVPLRRFDKLASGRPGWSIECKV
jgi:hypothetical protein